jgi:acyl phosphate:glycerol-3-phosphate acyltransferase
MTSAAPTPLSILALLLLAYAAGSLPFALWMGRLHRIDLRAHGSGNLGATNALRVLGKGWGIATLLLDIGKGFLAVAWMPGWLGLGTVAGGSLWPLVATLAAVLGHLFSPWTRFRGGKGVATTLGAFLALSPWAALIGVLAFVAVVWLCRYVSVGSQVMILAFTLGTAMWGPPWPLRGYVLGIGILLSALIAWRHRANWVRVARGTESRFRWRGPV